MVALFAVVLALTTEGTGDGTPVGVRHLSLPTGVGLLLLALEHEALTLITVRGMHEAALLVSGVTPEEVLHIAHIASILRGSPLSRSRSLMPAAMVARVTSSGAVGVELPVTLPLQRQLQ